MQGSTHPKIEITKYPLSNWKDLYHEAKQPIPPCTAVASGKTIDNHMFIESNQDDVHTCISFFVFLIYLNSAQISKYFMRKFTIQICTFGAEFVALKTDIKTLIDGSY